MKTIGTIVAWLFAATLLAAMAAFLGAWLLLVALLWGLL